MSLFFMTSHPTIRPSLFHTASPEFAAERRLFLKGVFPRGKFVAAHTGPGAGHALATTGRTGRLVV